MKNDKLINSLEKNKPCELTKRRMFNEIVKHTQHTKTPLDRLHVDMEQDTQKEKPIMKKRFSLLAVAITILLVFTTTAIAAWHFLSPSEVANHVNDHSLSSAFDSDDAVNIGATQTVGDYTFTLMSIVSGSDITDFFFERNGELVSDSTHAVVAIQRADGSPMAIDGGLPFVIAPYVRGIEPMLTLGGLPSTGSMDVIDGVLYVLIRTDDITMFADRGVYLGIHAIPQHFVEAAFLMNEETGAITPNPAFDGINILFDLPLDVSLADPVRAQQFIDDNSWLLDQ